VKVPELPEVEHLRRGLAPIMIGAVITQAHFGREDFTTLADGFASHRSAAQALRGATIISIERLGKHLAFVTDRGPSIGAHLGMSGRILVESQKSVPHDPHVHAVWSLRQEGKSVRLLFRDPRRFGGLWVHRTLQDLVASRWDGLGPDALTITGPQLRRRLGATRRAVKAALLDQEVLAGVGNIYADEALFAARLHPLDPVDRLSAKQIDHLASSIRSILQAAISAGGSTLRDYVDANGNPGAYATVHRVYAQGGKPCPVCEKTLIQTKISQRMTTFCASCQHPLRAASKRRKRPVV
jgi:formamidopyrimidine-DNA glycosylase